MSLNEIVIEIILETGDLITVCVYFALPAEDHHLCFGDTGRKFGLAGQTLTPRHTIDAILGIKNGEHQIIDGNNMKKSVFVFVSLAPQTPHQGHAPKPQ